MSKLEDAVTRYKGVANSLALLCIATEGYTQLDRLANVLSPVVVAKIIYDAERSMCALLSRKDILVEEKQDEKGYTYLQLITKFKDEKPQYYKLYGKPKDEETRNFIEEATNDLSVARKVAAYAVSIVANQKLYRLLSRDTQHDDQEVSKTKNESNPS